MTDKLWNQNQLTTFFTNLLPEGDLATDEWVPDKIRGMAHATYVFPNGDDIVINLDFGRLPSIRSKGEVVHSFEATVSLWQDHEAPTVNRVVSYVDQMRLNRVAILLLSQCPRLRETASKDYLNHLHRNYGVDLHPETR